MLVFVYVLVCCVELQLQMSKKDRHCSINLRSPDIISTSGSISIFGAVTHKPPSAPYNSESDLVALSYAPCRSFLAAQKRCRCTVERRKFGLSIVTALSPRSTQTRTTYLASSTRKPSPNPHMDDQELLCYPHSCMTLPKQKHRKQMTHSKASRRQVRVQHTTQPTPALLFTRHAAPLPPQSQ